MASSTAKFMEGKEDGRNQALPVDSEGNVLWRDENIDMSTDESKVQISLRIGKKLLAEKSPIIKKLFCSGLPDDLDMEKYSESAKAVFALYFSGEENAQSFVKDATDCNLILEVCLIADKYQIAELISDLEVTVDKLSITAKNLVCNTQVATKYKDMPATEKLSKKIVLKCAEIVKAKKLDILGLWVEYDESYSRSLQVLNLASKELKADQMMKTEKIVRHRAALQVPPPDGDESEVENIDDESQVQINLLIGKKLLAEKSPVFKNQFYGSMKHNSSSELSENLDMDEFSESAKAVFALYFSGEENAKLFAKDTTDCNLILEVYLMADKYQVDELISDLEATVNKLSITANNLVAVTSAVTKFKDLTPVENICKTIVQKCAEAVSVQKLDFLGLWAKYDLSYGESLQLLNLALTELQKEKMDLWPCQICRNTPCGHRLPGCQHCGLECSRLYCDQCRTHQFFNLPK